MNTCIVCLSSVLLWITLQLTEQQQREVWVTCGFNYWDLKRVATDICSHCYDVWYMQPIFLLQLFNPTRWSSKYVGYVIRTQSTHSFENVFKTKLVEIKYACFEGLCEDSRGQTGVCKSSCLRPPSPSLHTNLQCLLQTYIYYIYVILVNTYNSGGTFEMKLFVWCEWVRG